MSKVSAAPPAAEPCPICQQEECEHTDEQMAAARLAGDKGGELVLAGDEQQQRQRAIRDKKGLNKEADDLRVLMSEPRFRRWMWRHLARCGCNQVRFVPRGNQPLDPFDAAFRDGMANIGNMDIAALQEHCIPEWAKMIEENGRKNP